VLAEQYIDLDAMLSLPESPLPAHAIHHISPVTQERPVIAVAQDRAFCFTYAENLYTLEQLGANIVYFSPISDTSLPDCDGLYLPGGYPELYAEPLSENAEMRANIAEVIRSGMPTIAECGGFLYLHDTLETPEGKRFPMVGYFHGNAYPTKKLQRFGYVTLTAERENLLCGSGSQMAAHEFHYWESEVPGNAFHAVKPDGRAWECAHANAHIYAGFPHLYWYADPRPASRFVLACAKWKEERHDAR
jgi:cobyrinic acid a,c-diamide synthase